MKQKQIIDLVIAVVLILCGTLVLIFPLMSITNVKLIFTLILGFYSIINLIQFLTTRKSKDYESLFTTIASIITLIVALKINVALKPWNLAISLFIWVMFMALIKLKKCDYYNDRKNIVWIVRFMTLILFVLTGVLCTINLYFTEDVQVLVLGFFFYIHGILEIIDPISVYISDKET